VADCDKAAVSKRIATDLNVVEVITLFGQNDCPEKISTDPPFHTTNKNQLPTTPKNFPIFNGSVVTNTKITILQYAAYVFL
jgi:hypothetical protein